MRRLFLIKLLMVLLLPCTSGQVKISMTCPDAWGPGRYSKVTVNIDFDRGGSFARFTTDYPEGFEIEPELIETGDFNWSGNQLNVVWLDLPESRMESFSYYVKPDASMSGSFDLEARLVIISGIDTRKIFSTEAKRIVIGGTGGITSAERTQEGSPAAKRYEFRVQVTTSSSNNPEEIRKRLKIGRDERITVVRSGQVFKYQVGSFSDYESAKNALEKYIGNGIKDAFIVAWDGNDQVPVNRAIDLGK